MLTEKELVELCRKHRLSEFAIATVRHVRESEPSRNVSSGSHNVATHYASRKMGCVIKAEARRTELAAIYEWDHDKTTYEFYDQPPRIKKIHDVGDGRNRSTSYTPDFFILAEDFIGWVECKPEGWLLEKEQEPNPPYIRDEQGQWRCPPAEAYAQSVGLSFAVRSSYESDPIITQNIADLSDYYHPDCPPPTEEQLQSAQQLMGDAGWCWLRDLISNDAGLSVDTIFKMIADELLHVDLHAFPLMNEAHRVRVFRTRALLESSALWLPPLLATPGETINPIAMKPGSTISWDGKACEILNIGQSEVFLRSADSPMQSLQFEAFERMVKQGVIVGTEEVADPRTERASERLRRATAEDLRSAMHRHYCIHPDLCPREEVHKASDRAIRKWKAMARQGNAECGNEFVGLLPTISRRGNRRRRLDARTLEILHEVIERDVTSSSAKGYFACWSTVVDMCKKEGLLPPSKRTFEAEIARRKTPEELKKARQGEKAGYDLELPYLSLERETPKHGCRPFDVAHIDHTQLDLQFVDEGTGANMGKAWLTVMIDAFTRVILAWVILFNEPSYRSCMLVARDCVRRHARFPRTVVADQGSEFKGRYFDMLLAYLGSHKRMRPTSHPRFGSIIERFFGLNNTQFVHTLRGNNQALQSPRRMSPTHDPVKLAVWNLRAFRGSFESFLGSVYHAVEHPALGISPLKAMEIGMLQAGARSHMLIPYTREFVIATMPTTDKETSKIQPDGSFKANRIDYFSERLISYAGQDRDIRYDPYDVSRAYAMGTSGWIEATSMYASELAGRSEKEIEAISLQIDEINKRTGIREKDRAAALGAFLASMREREGTLAIETQVARDRELRAADEGVELIDVPSGDETNVVELAQKRAGKSQRRAQHEIVFENTTHQTFEDF